jgi:uncharacterized protein (TIGR03437 family)
VGFPVTFHVTAALPVAPNPGPPLAISVVNAASLAASSVAPGELVTIYGLDLQGGQAYFNGVLAPALYTSAIQMNVVAPYEIAGQAVASLAIVGGGQVYSSGVPVTAAAPGIFTADSSGVGAPSGVSAMVARGSTIHLIVTGLGLTSPAETTGEIVADTAAKPILPVAVTIGGVNATVVSIGSVPNQVAGLFGLDVVVPAGVAPGNAVPVVLTAGSVQSPSGVTIAIR